MEKIFSAGLAQRQPFATKLIQAQVANNRLAGAYLLTGRALDDKILLGKELVSALNCSERAKQAESFCILQGQAQESWCANCRWIAQDEHPQAWQTLAGDETKTGKIPVEKARALSEELAKTSQYCRGVVVKQASEEYFHRPAANALLKTIEEPKGRVVFLLFALTAADVLKTVVSRCQIVELRFSDLGNEKTGAGLDGESQKALAQALAQMKELAQKRGRSHVLPLEAAANLAQSIQDLVGPETPLADILDYLVAEELADLHGKLAHEPEAVKYARELLQSSERSKLQSDHFVSEKAIIDAFAFRWAALKEQYIDQRPLEKEVILARGQ